MKFPVVSPKLGLGMILPLSQANGLVIFVKLLVVDAGGVESYWGIEMEPFFFKGWRSVCCFYKLMPWLEVLKVAGGLKGLDDCFHSVPW